MQNYMEKMKSQRNMPIILKVRRFTTTWSVSSAQHLLRRLQKLQTSQLMKSLPHDYAITFLLFMTNDFCEIERESEE